MRGAVVLVALAACGRIGFENAPDAGSTGIPIAQCPPREMTSGTVVTDVTSLVEAVAAASPGDVILIADGTYILVDTLEIRTPNLTLRSASGDARSVVIDGRNTTGPVIYVRASDIELVSLTIARGNLEGLMVEPLSTAAADRVAIYDLTFLDNANSAVRVRPHRSLATGPFSDGGSLECSRVITSNAGTCGSDGVFGFRLIGVRTWLVRANYFSGRCGVPESRAMWINSGSRDVVVTDNVFEGNPSNLMLGGAALRTYPDPLPAGCSGTPDVWGGLVCNNRIAGLGVMPRNGNDFEEGIALWSACDTWVMHNTVVSPGEGEAFGEIEYRFTTTYVHLLNNLTSMPPLARDGGAVDPASQTTQFSSLSDFVDAGAGDLRISVGSSIPAGASIDGLGRCELDAAGRARSLAAPTPGAFER